MFNREQEDEEELPVWSVKRQKAYKISRILWVVQIIIALIASIIIGLLYVSCSENVVYKDSMPRISINAGFYQIDENEDMVLKHEGEVLLNDNDSVKVKFGAELNMTCYDETDAKIYCVRSYSWVISPPGSIFSSQQYPEYTFEEAGIYHIKFYAIDYMNDTLYRDITIEIKQSEEQSE